MYANNFAETSKTDNHSQNSNQTCPICITVNQALYTTLPYTCDVCGWIDDIYLGDVVVQRNARRNPRKSNKRTRMMRYKRKLSRLYHANSKAIYITQGNSCNDSDSIQRLARKSYSHSSASRRRCGRVQFFKNYCNRKLRRYRGDIGRGNYYRKVNDYWWGMID